MKMDITLLDGKKVRAKFDKQDILTDQPVDAGGEDSAPSPWDLFMASLGTCAGYFVLEFCRGRDIPTENIRLSLSTTRDVERWMLTEIKITIHLPPGFPEKYRDAVMKAAGKCSVKKHMLDPPEFVIETA